MMRSVTFLKRRDQLLKNKRGFTIVELIIVIVVIAILAAVAIVAYGNWRTSLAEKSLMSDMKNLVAAMNNAKNWQNGYPVIAGGSKFDGSGATSNIYVQSKDSDISYYAGDGTAYCIEALSKVDAGVYYYYSSSEGGEPKKGNCQYGTNYNPSMPTQVALTASTNYSPRAMTVDPANGDIYLADSGTVYKYTQSTGQFTTVYSGVTSDAIEFGGNGKLYVFSGSPGGDPGPTYVQAIDIATGVKTDVSSTTINRGRSLYKSGNILYAAGRERIFAYNLTDGSATELYYNGSNIYSEGITVVGNDLYFLVTQGTIRKMPVTGGAPTTYATPPIAAGSPTGAVGLDLIYNNGYLYTFGNANGSLSIYRYKMATGVWEVVVANVRPQTSGCIYPEAFTIYAGRVMYVSAEPSDWVSCSPAAATKKLYMKPFTP